MNPPAKPKREEIREHQRVEMRQPVGVQIPGWATPGAECLDISHGGMRVRIRQQVAVGDRMVFKLTLPAHGDCDLVAEVRHVSRQTNGDFEIGLRWTDSDPTAVSLFETMVRDHLRGYAQRPDSGQAPAA